MSDSKLLRFFFQLRERRVVRATVLYAAVAWAITDVTATVFPILGLAAWTTTLVVALLATAFPFVLILSWMVDITSEGIRTAEQVAATPSLGPRFRWWGLVLVIALVSTIGAWRVFARPALAPLLSDEVIAILPFSVGSSGSLQYLREGMVELLSAKLDGVDGLRAINPQTVVRMVGEAEGGLIDPGAGRALATELGAGWFILGSVVGAGNRASLSASLYRTNAEGEGRASTAQVEGSVDDGFFQVVDALAARLLARRIATGGLPEAAAVSTGSFAAFREYLAGERSYRLGNHVQARSSFLRAIEADTAFALAYLRVASADGWLPPHDYYRPALAAAHARRARLTPRYREFVEIREAQQREDPVALTRLHDFLRRYPDDAEAWLTLGEELFHGNGSRGRSPTEAREALERAAAFDPGNQTYFTHLAEITLAEGRVTEIDSLMDRFGRRNLNLTLRLWHASAVGDDADRDSLLTRWREVPIGWWAASQIVHNGSDRLLSDLRARVPAILDTASETSAHSPARLAAAFGKASTVERTLSRFDGNAILALRALLASLPLAPPRSNALEAIRDELSSMDLSRDTGTWLGLGPPVVSGTMPVLRLYLLGLVSGGLGDETAVKQYAAELRKLESDPPIVAYAGALAAHLEAEAALRNGRAMDALSLLDDVDAERISRLHFQSMGGGARSDFFPPVRQRFLRAEALAAGSREAEAVDWFVAITHYHTQLLLPYVPLAHARLGDLLSARDPERAARHYEHFLALWRDADPELQPLVTEVRDKLRRLRN
jgi:tetratricopeptide (TPR) repeat protein